MAIIDRIIGPALDRYMSSVLNRGAGGMTHSGQRINGETPFNLISVRSAISILAQDVASTPLELWRTTGKVREKAIEHPLYGVLTVAPNGRMTAMEWREAAMVALLTWGNSYAYIQRDEAYRVVALWPLRPDRVLVTLSEDGRLAYRYNPINDTIAPQTFDQFDILHVKGLSSDGLVGRTPLFDLREKLGEIKAEERFSQSFYGNGMKRGAAFTHPGTLSDTAFEHLKKQTSDEGGAEKAWKTLILEEGVTFTEMTFAPEDAQLLQTREFSVEEICRAFNLPPYKMRITKPGAVSYASVESQQLDYLLSTLNGWYVRIEQAVNRACLSLNERNSGLHVIHNSRTMLRADLKSQAAASQVLRNISAVTVNEVREDFGYNPSDDPRADDLFAPTYVQGTAQPPTTPDDMAMPFPDMAPPVQ